MTKFAYFEKEIVPIESATIGLNNNTFHYGTGCFGGIRAYWNDEEEQLYIFRIEEHYERFLSSAKLLHCNLDYTKESLKGITVSLLRKEEWRENVYIRPIAYKDDDIMRVWLHDSNDKVGIFSQPVGDFLPRDHGIKVCVSGWRRVDDTAIPARGKVNGTYVNSALAKSDAMLSGFDEAILLNHDGHVSEATAANFMMVRKGQVITPPITANLLEGITRRSLIQLIRDELKVEVVERPIDRSELYIADEAFFCGTGVQMAPIGSIDHRIVGDGSVGPITKDLAALQYRVLTGRETKYKEWLTPIY